MQEADYASLVNSCLICRCSNQDGDFVSLYGSESLLSPAGELYEELLGIQLNVNDIDSFPQFLCNSCELQIRLFKKLKTKAIRTLESLEQERCLYKNDMAADADASEGSAEGVEEQQAGNTFLKEEEFIANTDADVQEIELATEEYLGYMPEAQNSDYFVIEHSDTETETETTNQIQTETTKTVQLDANAVRKLYNESELPVDSVVEYDGDQAVTNASKADKELVQTESPEENYGSDDANIYTDVVFLEDEGTTHEQEKSVKKRNKKLVKQQCFACNLEFTDRGDYLSHRIKLHNSKYPCSHCPKLLGTADALRVHLKLHLNQAAFQCELCNRSFNQKVHYNYHMLRHQDIRNFKCEYCEKAFISKADLNMHVRIHTNDRRYQCDICHKNFFLQQHLKMHRYVHSAVKRFECPICNKKMSSPTTLRMHVLTIHEAPPRFECYVCNKKFRRKHHLDVHVKIHQRPERRKSQMPYTAITEEEDDLVEFISVLDESGEEQEFQDQEIVLV